MTDTIKYNCNICGQKHEQYPALAFSSPFNYNILSDDDKENIADLSSDFCIIKYPDQTDQFIRGTLTQKVIDHCEDLDYGVWVSLSKKSFQDYSDNFNNDNYETSYFGWLSSSIPGYDDTTKIPTTVFTKTGNQRPEIVPHKNFDHPFVNDYYNGITKEQAKRRIKEMFEIIR